MAVYRLSCACGEAVPVAVGRAGGAIDCPRCGTRIQIPKLRELRDLPPWEFSPESAADGLPARGWEGGVQRDGDRIGNRRMGRHGSPSEGWGTAEAVLAAGSLIAAASLLVAAWLVQPATTGIDAAVIRDAIGQASAADIYRAWRSFSDSGVARGATPDEDRVRRITKNRATLAVAVGLLGGVGGLAAIGAAAAIVAKRRLGGPHGRGGHARIGT